MSENEELEKLRKRVDYLEAVAKMSDKHKDYADGKGMDDGEKEAWAKKTSEERDAHMKKNPMSKAEVEKIEKAKKKGKGGASDRANPPGPGPEEGDEEDVGGEQDEHGKGGMKDGSDIDKRKIDELQKRLDERDLADEVALCKRLCVENGLAEGDAEMLQKLRKVDPKGAESLLKRTKAMMKQAEGAGLFNEVSKGGGVGGATAYEQMRALAKDMVDKQVVKSGEKRMSIQQAFDKVYNDPANAELRKQHKDEEARRRLGRAA